MGIVQVQNLNKALIKEYIEMIKKEDIERETKLLNIIKEILIKNIDNLQLERKGIKIQHKKGQNFEGIIYYLEKKYGKNILEQGKMAISASSTSYGKPETVINFEVADDWYSNGCSNNWIEFNFNDLKVKLNGYSIKS